MTAGHAGYDVIIAGYGGAFRNRPHSAAIGERYRVREDAG